VFDERKGKLRVREHGTGSRARLAWLAAVLAIVVSPAAAQQIAVQEHVLDNGMTLLLVPREGDPNVAAGWVAKVGSVNERPGITGISHLFEHMMFKGTHVIGTKDIAEDLRLMQRMDDVKKQLRVEEQAQLRRSRLGEIGDASDPANRTERHRQLLAELAELDRQQKALMVKNEFDQVYREAGASGLNAGTDHDFTIYFINVPANKLELWFWMESDRLLNPVFREFYAERDVVREERRLRTESTPTGRFEEQFDALFWQSSPYLWPVVGWPSDLEAITREEAQRYYDLNYAPNNIAACLVGDFDPAEALRLANRYFGRLKRNAEDPPPVRTEEIAPVAERRMTAYAETEPQVEMRYLTVPDGHRDDYALTVLGSLLSGRTGRLYKSLVLDQQVATAAGAGQNSLKWAGYFTLSGVARPGHTPQEVEQALSREIEKLQQEPVGDRELQKVKNRYAADSFRRIESNFALMLQLLLAENGRGWESFNEDPKRLQDVTPADVQRVAREYFEPDARAVITYFTKQGTAPPDPSLEGLSAEERAQVQQMRGMIAQMPVDQARMFLQKLKSDGAKAPPEKKKLIDALEALLQERIAKGGQP
jgi:predicted Zn-dependent peptidase